MSAFLSDLTIRALTSSDGVSLKSPAGHLLYTLTNQLIYESDAYGIFSAEAGFVTDLGTIIRLPILYELLDGEADREFVLHDWIYTTGELPRDAADLVLCEALLAHGVQCWKVEAIYAGVRAGGARHYLAA